MNDRVKIVFRLQQDENGYPPEGWEGVWAIPLGGERYRIDNIPFYVNGISCDDVVRAAPENGEFHFKKLLEPSGNSTLRIIIYDTKEIERVRSDLRAMGCSVEGTGIKGLLSINIPGEVVHTALQYIRKGFEGNLWDYEESALREK